MESGVFANDRLRLSITNSCNFNCPYCSNEGQTHKQGLFISLDFVRSLSKWVKNNNIYIRKLNITGGEPLLHPNLISIIEILSECAEMITLNTNGELLNKDKIRELHDAGVKNIKFGIDSLSESTTKPCLTSRKNGNPKLVLENLLFANELMPRSSVNVVITAFNAGEIEKILKFTLENKIDLIEIIELIPFDFRGVGCLPEHGPLFDEIFSDFGSWFCEFSYNPQLAKYIFSTKNGIKVQFAEDFCLRRVCQNLWTRINAEGKLLPCIKKRDTIPIVFDESLLGSIRENNKLMCNGPNSYLPRNYCGKLINTTKKGEYIAPEVPKMINKQMLKITKLDP